MTSNIFDFDAEGRTSEDGCPLIYEEQNAINNALANWLTSKRGEFLKNPGAGGVLDYFLFKSLKKEMLNLLGFTLQNALTLTWSNVISLIELQITPNYTERMIEISIKYSINSTGAIDEVSVFVDKTIDKINYEYIEVDYIEVNLYTFITIQKPSHPNDKLIFDTDNNVWIWGSYKLVNLTETDSYFDDILAICNTE